MLCAERGRVSVQTYVVLPSQYQNRDPGMEGSFLEAVDDAFKTMDGSMAESMPGPR